MVDTVTLPTGEKILTDELTTLNGSAAPEASQVQRAKMGFGADGDFKDVSASEPLPVSTGLAQGLTESQLRAASITVRATEDEPLPSNGVADWLLRRLAKAIGRLSFDATNQLRAVVSGSLTTAGTVSTVTTVTTSNNGMGDAGKPATSTIFTRQLTGVSTRRNLIRS